MPPDSQRITETPRPIIGENYQLMRGATAKVIAITEHLGVVSVTYQHNASRRRRGPLASRCHSMEIGNFHDLFSGHYEPADNVLEFGSVAA